MDIGKTTHGKGAVKVLVLDFDNCLILDEQTREGSEEIKDRAWFDVFNELWREELAPVLKKAQLMIAGGKGDRRDIVEVVLRHFGFSCGIEEIASRLAVFDKIVQEEIKKIPVSKSVYESLERISARLPVYLNTATPLKPILNSIHALRLANFFKDVYGRPGTKESNLREIIAAEGVSAPEVLMVDDQQKTADIAAHLGCQFIGIHTKRNKLWHDVRQSFPVIYSLAELEGIIF